MFFGRHTRTMIPTRQHKCQLNGKRESRKQTVKKHYDKHAKKLPEIQENQNVYFKRHMNQPFQKGKAKVANNPNFTITSTDDVEYNRNREHIRPTSIPVFNRDQSPGPSKHDLGSDERATPQNAKKSNSGVTSSNPKPTPAMRPHRETKVPSYLKDYVRY